MKNSTKMKRDFLGCYKVYSSMRHKGIDSLRWHYYKLYSTKAGAKAAIKRAKLKYNELLFKIVYCPAPYNDEYDVVVYDESINEGVKINETCY